MHPYLLLSLFARWGGEEFIILLPRTDIKTAYLKAQELRKMTELYISKKLPTITIKYETTLLGSYIALRSG